MTAAAERTRVRDLARQVRTLADEPRMAAILRRWRDVNELRAPDRPPVWCRPVGCWKELLPETALHCSDPWLRGLERDFRQTLIKRDIDDDTPVYPFLSTAAAFDAEPANLWGFQIRHQASSEADGAWAYAPPLQTDADVERLRRPVFRFNAAATAERRERMQDLLGDIFDIRVTGGPALSATLGTVAADLRGLETMMLDMAVAPELMHRLMACMRDGVLASLDAVAAAGLVTPNHHGPMLESDPFGPPLRDGCGTWANAWCMADSQEFDQVSPAMWEEFCLAYQKPILARFGRVSYGCCENLTQKIRGVLSIPNLRLFVCSAWTNLDTLLEHVSPAYCIMWRQKASAVVFAEDEAALARDLHAGIRKLRGRPFQLVLRELQTLAGHPDRLHAWTRLAKTAAEKWNG